MTDLSHLKARVETPMDSKIREEIARVIESHDAFECRSGWTYPEAAGAIADALLPLLQRSYQAGQEAMRERAVQKVCDLRCAAAGNFSPSYSGAEGMARTDSFAEAAQAIRALPLSDKE